MTARNPLRRIAREMFSVWRDALNRDAYTRYLAHQRAHHPDEPVLNRRDFYLRAQERKWSGVNRCC